MYVRCFCGDEISYLERVDFFSFLILVFIRVLNNLWRSKDLVV